MSNLQLAWSMLISPSAAFAELRERPRFWFPLLALIATTLILVAWYFSIVDFEWYKEHVLSAQLQRLPEEPRARMLEAVSQQRTLRTGLFSSAISIVIVLAIQAGYYFLAGKAAGVKDSFRQWFAMVCWTGLPTLVSFVVSIIMLAMASSNAQIGPGAIQPLSFNELFFQLEPGATGYAVFSSLSLVMFWSLGLLVIGVRDRHNKSWTFSTIFVLLPFAVIYACVAWFAFK